MMKSGAHIEIHTGALFSFPLWSVSLLHPVVMSSGGLALIISRHLDESMRVKTKLDEHIAAQ